MTSFSLTWDYRCPFARIVHLHVLDGLAAGADWDVRFVPFSLGQVHVGEGQTPIWDRPGDDSGLLALQVGVVVRDQTPETFDEVHRSLFDARHVQARQLDEATVRDVLGKADLDADAVLAEVATGEPLRTVRAEHESVVASHGVWGVPTFILGEQAVFVRIMDIPPDPSTAVSRIDKVLGSITGFPELNELKHTRIPR